MKIGFIGTGVMGKSMAGHLLAAGHELAVHTRTAAKAEDLLERGALWAHSPAEAGAGRDVVISMVGFPADVEEIHLGSCGTLSTSTPPGLVIDMTTSTPSLARRLAEAAAARLMDGTFTLEDFLEQMQQIKKMGPIGNLMGMMPGIPKEARDLEIDDRHIARLEGIIRSMTPEERTKPAIIDGSRRTRIATGKNVVEVEQKLLRHVPREFRRDAHHWLILHGRYTCLARKPRCGSCVIEDLCEFPDKLDIA